MATKKDDYHDCEKEHGKGLVDPCMQLLCADYRGVHVPVRRYFFGQGTVCSQLDRCSFSCLSVSGTLRTTITRGKKIAWKVIYWVALAIYLFGCVFGIIRAF